MISETGPSQPDMEATGETDLYAEIENLRARVAALETQVGTLQTNMLDESEVIVLRTVERKDAVQEILQLFQSEKILFYSDIATRLRFDLQTVVEICQELIETGEIEINDNHAVSTRRCHPR